MISRGLSPLKPEFLLRNRRMAVAFRPFQYWKDWKTMALTARLARVTSSSMARTAFSPSPACCNCWQSGLKPTLRSYATASRPVSMATVVDSVQQTKVPQAKPFRPDPLVLSPVKAGAVEEAVDALREDIGRPIYLDMQATTPVDPRVLDAMLPYMTNQFGNPHSRTHAYGWETEKAVEEARQVRLL